MAKQFKPKTSGINVDEVDNTEGSVENTVEAVDNTDKENLQSEGVQINSEIEQKPVVKNVSILPKENHNCCVGGVRYYLKKGVRTNVPLEVKNILNKSGLLMPL